jgi:hypothetical protein
MIFWGAAILLGLLALGAIAAVVAMLVMGNRERPPR